MFRLAFHYIIFFHLVLTVCIWGKDQPVFELVLESDEPIVYEDDNATITARQNATLRGTDFLVLADQIAWSRESGDGVATGSVSLTQADLRILADEVHFSTTTGDFMAINSRGGYPPKYFIAETIERNASLDTYRNAIIYNSEPGPIEPNIRTKLYTYDKNTSKFAISPAQVKVGNILVGVLPGYSGYKKSDLWGLSSKVKAGKDSVLGWYGETQFSYNWQELTSTTRFTYYLDRGTLVSPQISLKRGLEDGFISSQLYGGWVNDTAVNPGIDARNRPINTNRGYAHFRGTARIYDRWHSSALIEWESDSEIIRDFKRDYFYTNQWNQSHSELSYEGEGYTISILARWQTNNHEAMVEHLPLINFDFGPNKIGKLNLFHSSSLTYTNLAKRDEFGISGDSIHRMNLGYKLERPILFESGLRLTPSVAWMHQDYQMIDSSKKRFFGEYGIDLHASLHQVIPYQNETWEIDQLLHLMRFSIGLRDTHQLSGARMDELPDIHTEVDDLNLSPLDLLDCRNHEIVSEKQLIRIGWENILLGKWNNSSRNLASMQTYYDLWDGNSVINGGDFLNSDVKINPSFWLSLNLRHKIDIKSGKNYRQSYGIDLKDGRFQGASLGYISYLDFNNYSYFSAWKRMNEKLSVSARGLYDIDKSYLTYWNGRFDYKSGSNWIWDFSISQRKGTRDENNIEWSFGISWGGFTRNQSVESDGLNSIYSM